MGKESENLINRLNEGLSDVEIDLIESLFGDLELGGVSEQLLREELLQFTKMAMLIMSKGDRRRKKLLNLIARLDTLIADG